QTRDALPHLPIVESVMKRFLLGFAVFAFVLGLSGISHADPTPPVKAHVKVGNKVVKKLMLHEGWNEAYTYPSGIKVFAEFRGGKVVGFKTDRPIPKPNGKGAADNKDSIFCIKICIPGTGICKEFCPF